jgi:ATP-dependent protease ClpP protease subunit
MLRRVLYAATLCGALALPLCGIPANASESEAHASTASTSRWWKLDCGVGRGKRESGPAGCTFQVKLRGVIDGSRLRLVRQALQRRDAARRALAREVTLHVDVDSPGGEIFSTLEIGRMLRAEGASISVGRGASCISACVFLLMGAIERRISSDARLGIHRPSLRGWRQGGPNHASEGEIVDAMTEQLAGYAEEMNVPREIVDALMLVPPDRVELLGPSELARYGIYAIDPVAMAERRARSPSLRDPRPARGR